MEADKVLTLLNILSQKDKNGKVEKIQGDTKEINLLNEKIDNLNDVFTRGLRLMRDRMNEIENKPIVYSPKLTKGEVELINQLVEKKMSEITIDTKDVYTSKVRMRDNETVTDRTTLASAGGMGLINQILCEAQTNDFHIFVMVDDNVMFDKDYSYFFEHSKYLENISGFLDNGVYYLSIRTLNFKKNFRIYVYSDTSVVFNHLLVKYIIKDEIPRE